MLWNNDDVETTLKVTRGQWAAIVAGEPFSAGTWSWYEGKRQRAVFSFNDPEPGDLNVGGEEMAEHYVGRIGDAEIWAPSTPGLRIAGREAFPPSGPGSGWGGQASPLLTANAPILTVS